MVLDYPSSSDQSPVTSVVNTPTKRTAPSPPTSPSRLRCERSLYKAPSGSPICGTRGVPNSYFFDLKGFLHWNDGSRFASQSCSAETSAKESSKETCSISSLVENPERKDRLQIATIATICPSKSLPAVIHSWGGVCFQESHYSQRQSAEFVFGFRGIPPLTASSVGVRHSTNSWKYIPIHVILWNRKKHLTILQSWGVKAEEEMSWEYVICYGKEKHLHVQCKSCGTMRVCCSRIVGVYQSINSCPIYRFRGEY